MTDKKPSYSENVEDEDMAALRQENLRLQQENEKYKKMLRQEEEYFCALHKKLLGINSKPGQTVEQIAENIFSYLENIIAVVPGHVYWFDKNNVHLGCNDEMARVAGLVSRYDVVGKTNNDLPWKDSAQKLHKINEHVIATGEPCVVEEGGIIANGEYRTFLTKKSPLRNQANEIIGIVGVSLDITERKRQEDLERNRKEYVVEEKLKLMRTLAGHMAHDMRTPLATLRLYLDLMKDNDGNGESKKLRSKRFEQFIDISKYTIKLANHFIDMLLVKLQTLSEQSLDKNKFYPNLIYDDVKEALSQFPTTEDERQLIFWENDTAESFTYIGNAILTRHVLFNLLQNSLRAIQEESRGKITIKLVVGEEFNQLIFTDTACGIAPELIPNLFSAFFSKDVSQKDIGLGLAFCKTVLDAYGGSITCDTKYGEYTRFILSFPKAIINF